MKVGWQICNCFKHFGNSAGVVVVVVVVSSSLTSYWRDKIRNDMKHSNDGGDGVITITQINKTQLSM